MSQRIGTLFVLVAAALCAAFALGLGAAAVTGVERLVVGVGGMVVDTAAVAVVLLWLRREAAPPPKEEEDRPLDAWLREREGWYAETRAYKAQKGLQNGEPAKVLMRG